MIEKLVGAAATAAILFLLLDVFLLGWVLVDPPILERIASSLGLLGVVAPLRHLRFDLI